MILSNLHDYKIFVMFFVKFISLLSVKNMYPKIEELNMLCDVKCTKHNLERVNLWLMPVSTPVNASAENFASPEFFWILFWNVKWFFEVVLGV